VLDKTETKPNKQNNLARCDGTCYNPVIPATQDRGKRISNSRPAQGKVVRFYLKKKKKKKSK
jgi:hypothetical protein